MTAWSTINKNASIILSNNNLTAQGQWQVALVYADTGVAANDPGDHTFTLLLNTHLGGSVDYGVAIAGQATNARIGYYDPTTHYAITASIVQDARFWLINFTSILAGITGGVPIVPGDLVQFRMKNGFLYVRYSSQGFTYGPWNGVEGTYAGANADAGTGGIPLSAFGSAQLFPYMYLEGDTVTADFTAWAGAATFVTGAGNAPGFSSLTSGRGAARWAVFGKADGQSAASAGASTPPSIQTGAGNAVGRGTAAGSRSTGLFLSLRSDKTAFKVKSGLGIMWPFLNPTGTDTGIAATSHYDVNPYVDPSSFAVHVGSWLTNVAFANKFDHIRLHVNPGPIMEAELLGQTGLGGQSNRKNILLDEIFSAVDLILASGLKVIIDLELTGFVTGYSAVTFLDNGSNFNRYLSLLQSFAGRILFSAYKPDQVALELFNEPPNTSEFSGNYSTMLSTMHLSVRSIMPNHTIIATCAGYSSPANLVLFDPSAFDKNTLWSFHWYPLSSIQGKTRNGSASSQYFDSYDWEKRPDERPAILAQVIARVNADPTIATPNKASKITAVMVEVDDMISKGRDFIDSQMAAVVAWSFSNNVSIICGEYGVTGAHPGG